MTDDSKIESSGILSPASLVMLLWSMWMVYWFRAFLGGELQANTDLFGHIFMVERLGATWWDNPVFFYDRAWFTGWPAFQFYGFLPHLLAFVVSIPLRYFVSDPVRFSVYILCVAQLSVLHWSVLYAARPFYSEVVQSSHTPRSSEVLFALAVCAFTFWFLNQDGAAAGIGASAILGAGLFSQLPGWHLLLVYVGLLGRLFSQVGSGERSGRISGWYISLLIALMVCTHTLTTLYGLFIGFLAGLRFAEWRRFLLRCHLLGLGLSAFWLFPMIAMNSDFGVNHTEPPTSGFLTAIFRYPWIDVARSVLQVFHGRIPVLSVLEVILPLMFLSFFSCRKLGEWRWVSNFIVFILIGLVIFSSPFTAAALPLGIHYYRLDSYAVLLLIPVLSVIPFSFMENSIVPSLNDRIVRSLTAVMVLLVILSTSELPGVELGFVNAVNREKIFSDQRDVLNFFKGKEGIGRVLFDYFIDPKRFLPATPHYMPSNLFKESGLETINGLFIQSSVAYQFPVTSAVALGLDYYAAPSPFAEPERIQVADAIRRLLSFGVTHIVSTDGPHLEALTPFLDGQVFRFGPYVILPLKDGKFSPVTPVTAPVVGYLDEAGSLPFRLVEYFFYENAELWNRFEIIHLSDAAAIASGISLLLFNGDIHEAEKIARSHPDLEVVAMNFVPPIIIEHYNVRYNFHRGNEDYVEAKPYLQYILKTTLKPSLDKVASRAEFSDSHDNPSLRWSRNGQEFDLDGLEPGKMIRIDYSYFPFWGSTDGVLYRGGAERMIFLPEKRSAHFSYSRWRVGASWWGMGVTVVSVVLLFLL